MWVYIDLGVVSYEMAMEREGEREGRERERDVWKIQAQNRGTSIFLLGYPLVN